MEDDLPRLVSAKKELTAIPEWVERGGPDGLGFTVPLELDSVIVEGLTLRARACKSLEDREVIFQLEYHHSQIVGGPICRIEWRPLNGHNNRSLGPPQWRHINQIGSYHHRFDLNWARSKAACLKGDLSIAIPVLSDPQNYRALLGLVEKEFTIRGMQQIPIPPWQPVMV